MVAMLLIVTLSFAVFSILSITPISKDASDMTQYEDRQVFITMAIENIYKIRDLNAGKLYLIKGKSYKTTSGDISAKYEEHTASFKKNIDSYYDSMIKGGHLSEEDKVRRAGLIENIRDYFTNYKEAIAKFDKAALNNDKEAMIAALKEEMLYGDDLCGLAQELRDMIFVTMQKKITSTTDVYKRG
jgi:hypothetical protein